MIGGHYLNSQSRQNNGPKPLTIAQKVLILHTYGVQVNPKPCRRHYLVVTWDFPASHSVKGFVLKAAQASSSRLWETLEAQLLTYWVPVFGSMYRLILAVTQEPTIWVPGLLGKDCSVRFQVYENLLNA